jgi:isocitrate dehydrogenase
MKREHYLNTFEFLDRLAFNLQKKRGLKPSL